VLSLVAGLSTSHKIGLALVGGAFIVFALTASMLVPSRWPSFPGAGLRPFLAATAAFFVGMMLAVYFLARESESEAKEPPPTGTVGPASHVAEVSEVDFKIRIPATSGERGEYTFRVRNDGQSIHNLAVKGPGVARRTADLKPGDTAALDVDLQPGTYELYCAIPGHKQLGMDLKFTVS
jgi:hypothetical protein